MIFSTYILALLIHFSFGKTNNGHILVLSPPILSHTLPSLELAKLLSAHTYVTFVTSASVIDELERKGLLATTLNSDTLDVVGLIDGNNGSFSFNARPPRGSAKNQTKNNSFEKTRRHHFEVLLQIKLTLQKLFRLSLNMCPSSTIDTSSLRWAIQEEFITKPIFRPIDMVIAESFTPVPFLDIFVPVHIFISYNLQALVQSLNKRKLEKNKTARRMSHFLPDNMRQASGFLSNSWTQFDGDQLSEFYKLSGNQSPLRFVGPLTLDDEKTQNTQTNYIIQWLNKQPVASVIYVSFGSLVRLHEDTIRSYAKALETSSFIWSLKTNLTSPLYFPHLDETHQLVLDWAPQRAILAHRSVSFVICHGGWNSVMEAMVNGKAILVTPMFGDQFSNTQRIINLGIGRKTSKNLQGDIQHMKLYNKYAEKAKEIQSSIRTARSNVLKKEIVAIAKLVSKETNPRQDL